MPPALFFSLRIALAILALLWFHMMLGGIGAEGEGDDRG